MRTVLRNIDEVFHYWANQVQSEGRCGSVSFRGSKLYSYRALIASIVEFQGRRIAIHTTRSWSTTTSSHQSSARYASRHLEQIMIWDCEDSAVSQLRLTLNEIEHSLTKAKRARLQHSIDSHQSNAASLARDFNRYAEIRGETVRIENPTLDSIQAQLGEVEARLEEERVRRQAKYDAENAERIQRWRDGEGNYVNSSTTMLRLGYLDNGSSAGGIDTGSGWFVETSRGASIPVDDAKRLWPLILRVKKGDRDYEVGMSLGVYQLTKIRRDGSIVVGCHDIPFSEIESIAHKLDLIDEGVAA